MLVAVVIAAVFAIGVGLVPQFAGPGYEIALAYGLFLPALISLASSLELSSFEPEPFEAYCRGIANGVLVFGVAALICFGHGLVRGFCDPLSGLENLLLGPGVGAAVAGAYSAVVFELSRVFKGRRGRRAACILLALFGPLGSIGIGLVRFYTSPMIFGYDPFVGYFSGTLYDTVIDLSRLYTYRVGSAATLFAGFAIALHLTHDQRGRLVYQSIGRPGLLALGVLSAAGSMGMTLAGPELGHYQTSESIARELGSVVEGERCRVIHARSISVEAAQRFARDCEAHVGVSEAWLGVRGPERITAYLFEDASQKARLMGAGGTNIAKPWRGEVYVQGTAYPHRVLGHEIVHVVAASAGRGPFAIAGSLGGWLPKDLDILPPLERLFALAFLGEASSTAYTVSGAFVGWVHDKFGAEVVRAWYGGKDLAELTGKPWSELEQAWHAELDKITLVEAARVQAAARFDRPGFFARKCPRVVDACRGRASDLEEEGDLVGALAETERALAVDPGHVGLQIDRAETLLFGGSPGDARAALAKIAQDESVPRHTRDRALRVLGDYALYEGDVDDARKAYEELLTRTIDADDIRTLQVKLTACKDDGMRPAIALLLVGPPGRKADRLAATEILGALDKERPGDGLAPYLLARARLEAGDFAGAAARLDRALTRKLDVPFVRMEALRLRVNVACGLGDAAGATRWLAEFAKEPGVSPTRYATSRRLVARCAAVAIDSLPEKTAE